MLQKEKSENNALRRAKNRRNHFANLSDEDKKRILNHPFIKGVFTQEANKRRQAQFIESLGK